MVSNRLATLTLGIVAASGMVATQLVHASDARMQLAQAAPAAPEAGRHGPGMHEGRRGPDAQRPALFTADERAQFEQKMRGAKTPEERAALRKEMRAAFEQRAKEKGLVADQGPGQRPDRPQLTQRDHQRFQERWANAKTNEERAALRKEMLAAVDQRAQDRSAGRAEGSRPDGHHAGRADGRQPHGPMATLVTPQEREQFRDKMKSAKDRDERRKIRQEMHATVEARAKEKGIKLPEHRHPMRGPRSDGGERQRPQG